MTDMEAVVKQAISDFDDIQAAIEEKGVEVPYGTDTSEYGNKIRGIPSGTVDQAYNPESENAQSGKAVAQAVETKMDKFGTVFKFEDEDFSETFVEASSDTLALASANTLIAMNEDVVELVNRKKGGSVKIVVAEPTAINHAATKNYVDTQIGDINSILKTLVEVE